MNRPSRPLCSKSAAATAPALIEQRRQRSVRRRPEAAVAVVEEQLRLILGIAGRQSCCRPWSPAGPAARCPRRRTAAPARRRPSAPVASAAASAPVNCPEGPAAQDAQGIHGRAADHHRIQSAAIDVPDRQARTPAVEPYREQPLLRDLVDDLLARAQRQTGRLAHLGRTGRPAAAWSPTGSSGAGPGGSVMVKRRSTRQVFERLHVPAGPGHRQAPDHGVVPRGRNAPSARCWTCSRGPAQSWRACTPRALSIRTIAPTPKRLETVPRRSIITRWPVSLSLRRTVAPPW